MKIAYLDAFSGISGDMMLGALLDNGLPLDDLKAGLEKLGLKDYDVAAEGVTISGIAATRAVVSIHSEEDHHNEDHAHRHLSAILDIIESSELPAAVKGMAKDIFQRLAEAEARVHGTSPEKVHFHEVGALDSIIDIVGTCIGLHALKIERIYCSPLPLGRGFVKCAHGTMPLPAPATIELLAGMPTVEFPEDGETVTPTGAAIAAVLSCSAGPMPQMSASSVGYGAGTIKRRIPNLLRLVIGEESHLPEARQIALLESTIDDMNPEIYDYLLARLYAAGALEATLLPCIGKKSRPAVILSVIAPPEKEDELANIIFMESTTLGIRHSRASRSCLERKMVSVDLPGGKVGIKLGIKEGRVINMAPEYRDCRLLAESCGLPLKEIYRLALAALEADQKDLLNVRE